jgi:DNA-binding XRE family transcriptional regulator
MFLIELNPQSLALLSHLTKSPLTAERAVEVFQCTAIPPFSEGAFLCQFTGDSLRILRKAHKMTQTDLAALVGMHKTYISRLESGYCINPGLDTLGKLGEALNCKFMLI